MLQVKGASGQFELAGLQGCIHHESDVGTKSFIYRLNPQLFPQTVCGVDSIDWEIINKPHLVGLREGETCCNALWFAMLWWIQPPLLDFFLNFIPNKLFVFSTVLSCQGSSNCGIQSRWKFQQLVQSVIRLPHPRFKLSGFWCPTRQTEALNDVVHNGCVGVLQVL